MKQLITVHSHNCNQRSGFESSQQNRMYLAKLLNIPYIHIVTNPQDENFEDVYYTALLNIKDFSYDEFLPYYEGWGIHNIVDMYIDYKGNKYDVQPGMSLEAFAELMDMEYDNFSWSHEDE